MCESESESERCVEVRSDIHHYLEFVGRECTANAGALLLVEALVEGSREGKRGFWVAIQSGVLEFEVGIFCIGHGAWCGGFAVLIVYGPFVVL